MRSQQIVTTSQLYQNCEMEVALLLLFLPQSDSGGGVN